MAWLRRSRSVLPALVVLLSGTVGLSPASAVPGTKPCVVAPVLPHLIAFADAMEVRAVPLRTTCLLAGPVKLGVFADGKLVASIVWPGDPAHVVGNNYLGTLTLDKSLTPLGRVTVPTQQVEPADAGGATVDTTPTGFSVKAATRATLAIQRSGGQLFAYGATELFDFGWNKQEMVARLEVRRHGRWALYRRFDSDAKLAQGFYGDYRVRLPDVGGTYRVEIRATSTRARYFSRLDRS